MARRWRGGLTGNLSLWLFCVGGNNFIAPLRFQLDVNPPALNYVRNFPLPRASFELLLLLFSFISPKQNAFLGMGNFRKQHAKKFFFHYLTLPFLYGKVDFYQVLSMYLYLIIRETIEFPNLGRYDKGLGKKLRPWTQTQKLPGGPESVLQTSEHGSHFWIHQRNSYYILKYLVFLFTKMSASPFMFQVSLAF